MERWKNKLYEISIRRCVHIFAGVREIEFGSYRYDGMEPMDTLIAWINIVPKNQWALSLDRILIGIHARWWEVHREPHQPWVAIKASMQERFRTDVDIIHYMCSCESQWIIMQGWERHN
jgi:hypothetical protein